MKKCLIMLLVLLVLASAPAAAFADGTVYTEGTLYYTIGEDTITIVGCFGKNESITVPNSIGGLPVNTIASGAFAGNKYLKTVYLPDTVSSVEGGAFGAGVSVVYNYNVEGPVNTPPAGAEVRPSVEVYAEPTEAPVSTEAPVTTEAPAPEQPGGETAGPAAPQQSQPSGTSGGATGSGSTVVDDEPGPATQSGAAGTAQTGAARTPAQTGTAGTAAQNQAPAAAQTPVAQPAGDVIAEADILDEDDAPETPAPQSSAAPDAKPTEQPEQTAQPRKGAPVLPILIGLLAIAAIAAGVLAAGRKSGKGRHEKARTAERRSGRPRY